ncbi:MAG: hypothetical protein CME64_00195 [Halobacteriovoraceae bacterium]|nr:hypothetical protein [Halobacteriovoraceae bacterium]|tara:strand:- start:50040 stop:52601 length:2562 start_codon:yes stop_codon:yes gene_type:complete
MTVLKIAFRDLVNSRGFTALFLFNLFLGICGFVTLHSFRDNVNSLLDQRSKQLLSADVAVSGRRTLTKEETQGINDYLKDKAVEVMDSIEVYSMSKSKDKRSRLVQIKAVEKSFPFYGEVKLEKDTSDMEGLQKKSHIWVEPQLMAQMKLELGDPLSLGDKTFKVMGVIENDTSTSLRGIGLAPKVYVGLSNLKETNLISFGSVSTNVKLVKLLPEWEKKAEQVKLELGKILKDPGLRIRLPKDASEQVGRILNYLSDYLGLVGLVALFLSGIGSGYLFQNFLFEKLEDIGILKSLGMSLGQISMIYFLQLGVLSLASVLGANVFVWSILPLIGDALSTWTGMSGELKLGWETVYLSYLVAFGASLFICAPILLKMVGRKIQNLFQGGQFFRWEFEKRDLLLYAPLALFMWGLAVAQAHSFKIGTFFTLVLFIVVIIVSLGFPVLFSFMDKRWLTKKNLTRPLSLSWGLAARYFSRDRLSSTLTICALAIGVMLLSLIGQLETSLREELEQDVGRKPDLFLFDIQEYQKDGLVALAQEEGFSLRSPSPMVRSRILKINGEKFKRSEKEDEAFSTREEETSRRFRNRGINLSFADGPNESETIIEGRPFSGRYEDESKPAELSIERRYARRLGLEIGDTVTFEILGIEVQGVVVNLRRVRWTSFLPNFFIVFQPGAIDDAPKTYLAAVDSLTEEQRYAVQDKIVDKYSNVSIVSVTEIVSKIMNIFKAMAQALTIMAGLCLSIGFFTLYAITQNQLKKKRFEAAIQKVFGFSPGQLLKTLLAEYFILATLACVIGLGFSVVLGQVVSIIFFDGVGRPDWMFMLKIGVGVYAVTFLIAIASGRSFYSLKIKSLLS